MKAAHLSLLGGEVSQCGVGRAPGGVPVGAVRAAVAGQAGRGLLPHAEASRVLRLLAVAA